MRRGFTSGANDFFYLDKEIIKELKIEQRFLKPLIKGPKDIQNILINKKDLVSKVLICREQKKDLISTNALNYIKQGEKEGINKRVSFTSKNLWYSLDDGTPTNVFPMVPFV